ncbi:MAG TPA: helix-turn-helix domain-containing protein, partial [Thermomicrobiales bacterium]|nr:helix-turn-helix domain-containing protein [Thermomicrobiales bacterium]
LLLVDLLFESPAVTARSVAERIGVTQRAAYGLIQRFVGRGILLEATGRAYNQIFVAGGLLSPSNGDTRIAAHADSEAGTSAPDAPVV